MRKVKRQTPRMIKSKDSRLVGNVQKKPEDDAEKEPVQEEKVQPSSLFFSYNQSLGPPFKVIVDTNMLWQTVADKIDMIDAMQVCLVAKVIPCVTSCIVAELEKLGRKYHLALKLTKDPRVRLIKCGCRGNYADDCIVNTVEQNRVYIVATNDKDLKRRIRKVPGVPIMYLHNNKFTVERLPDSDYGAPRIF
ncbi:rRNA-processing protein FCF1 like protein [Tritrichomonas foetus]|uniref:rRNA-processing protein FCF1 like protein n=1 Tax=Tritrichomonas foetus TaxID=1144522 RepID=A0A1J4JJ10_9EUKA|nr:rRNA-processing protein FCF1 like protein [Tritrichomonas foetus]|eukprot:OHS97212.1 rRNA-processing protein FCF1 like protein [Tritrichomonas foetus]